MFGKRPKTAHRLAAARAAEKFRSVTGVHQLTDQEQAILQRLREGGDVATARAELAALKAAQEGGTDESA
jgi:hypothetical protein